MTKVAIVGTGGMARFHAQKLKEIKDVAITCACDIDEKRVKEYGKEHDIPATFTDYDAMLKEGDFEAISVVSTDATHADLSLRALAAGKHVLCEKPLATNVEDAVKMAEAAKKAGVINMVNFSYRNSSAWQKAKQMVEAGEIGTVRHFQAHYLQSWLSTTDWGDWKTSPNWLWRLSKSHGSHGALGDVGVHIIDFATGPIGHPKRLFCLLKTFDKADGGKVGEYVLDANDSALVTMECANGATGTLAITRWATGHKNTVALSIHGDKGAIRLDLDRSYEMMEICGKDTDGTTLPWESIYCGKTPSIWERFIESIRSGKQDEPDFARGAEIQKALDACSRSSEKLAMVDCR